jgi:hypothetical protein
MELPCQYYTPLFTAIATAQLPIVIALLRHGANRYHTDYYGQSPLLVAKYFESVHRAMDRDDVDDVDAAADDDDNNHNDDGDDAVSRYRYSRGSRIVDVISADPQRMGYLQCIQVVFIYVYYKRIYCL